MILQRFRFWFADVWARWWWLYVILGTLAPFWLPWIGIEMLPDFTGIEDCERYSSIATTC